MEDGCGLVAMFAALTSITIVQGGSGPGEGASLVVLDAQGTLVRSVEVDFTTPHDTSVDSTRSPSKTPKRLSERTPGSRRSTDAVTPGAVVDGELPEGEFVPLEE